MKNDLNLAYISLFWVSTPLGMIPPSTISLRFAEDQPMDEHPVRYKSPLFGMVQKIEEGGYQLLSNLLLGAHQVEYGIHHMHPLYSAECFHHPTLSHRVLLQRGLDVLLIGRYKLPWFAWLRYYYEWLGYGLEMGLITEQLGMVQLDLYVVLRVAVIEW